MKKISFYPIYCLLLMIIFTNLSLWAAQYQSLESKNFVIFYPEGTGLIAQNTLNELEAVHIRFSTNIAEKPKGKTLVTLEDVGMAYNGWANAYQDIHLFVQSPDRGNFYQESWLALVAVHEYTHTLHLNQRSKLSHVGATLFGNFISPNQMLHGWAIEGYAVYWESQISPYSGRLNNGLYRAYMQTQTWERKTGRFKNMDYGLHLYNPGYFYFHGSLFSEYLINNFGKDSLKNLYTETGSKLYTFFNAALPFSESLVFKIQHDESLKRVYRDHIREQYQLHRDQEPQRTRLTHSGWEKMHLNRVKKNQLVWVEKQRRQVSHSSAKAINKIVTYNTDTLKESLIYSDRADIVSKVQENDKRWYFLSVDYTDGFANSDQLGFGEVRSLLAYDIETKKKHCVIEQKAIRDFIVVDEQRILYLENNPDNRGTRVIEYLIPTQNEKTLLMSDLQISTITAAPTAWSQSTNTFILSAKNEGENLDLYIYTPGSSPEKFISSPWVETEARFMDDKLYFNANRDGYWTSYVMPSRFDSTLQQYSNSHFALNAVEVHDQVFFISLYSDGKEIAKGPKQWRNVSPAEQSLPGWPKRETVETKDSNLSANTRTLLPRVRMPTVSIDSEFNLLYGVYLSSFDSMSRYRYSLSADYNHQQQNLESSELLFTTRRIAKTDLSLGLRYADQDVSAQVGLQYFATPRPWFWLSRKSMSLYLERYPSYFVLLGGPGFTFNLYKQIQWDHQLSYLHYFFDSQSPSGGIKYKNLLEWPLALRYSAHSFSDLSFYLENILVYNSADNIAVNIQSSGIPDFILGRFNKVYLSGLSVVTPVFNFNARGDIFNIYYSQLFLSLHLKYALTGQVLTNPEYENLSFSNTAEGQYLLGGLNLTLDSRLMHNVPFSLTLGWWFDSKDNINRIITINEPF